MALPKELYNTKFSNYLNSLKIFYLVDDKFKAICDEYCNTRINVKEWEKRVEKDELIKSELDDLSNELEDEILIYLIRKN